VKLVATLEQELDTVEDYVETSFALIID